MWLAYPLDLFPHCTVETSKRQPHVLAVNRLHVKQWKPPGELQGRNPVSVVLKCLIIFLNVQFYPDLRCKLCQVWSEQPWLLLNVVKGKWIDSHSTLTGSHLYTVMRCQVTSCNLLFQILVVFYISGINYVLIIYYLFLIVWLTLETSDTCFYLHVTHTSRPLTQQYVP